MDTSKIEIELVKEIHLLFKKSGLRLSIAESCTGGLISHLITSLPGASKFFDSSVVCYSTESKSKLLGLSNKAIKKHGVISEEVSRAMAVASKKKRNTDIALAVTGNLGPDTMDNKQAGLVYIAVSHQGGIVSRSLMLTGRRGIVKMRAAMTALELLRDTMTGRTG